MLRKPFLSIAVACALMFTPVGAFAGHGHGLVIATAIKAVTGMDMGMGTITRVAITVMAIRATVMGTLTTTIITTITIIIATAMATAGGGTAAGGGMESAPAGAGRPMVTFGFATRRTSPRNCPMAERHEGDESRGHRRHYGPAGNNESGGRAEV